MSEARALLALDGPVSGDVLTAAFRRAVKAARPGMPDADETRFRRVIAAWRLLQTLETPLALPSARPAPVPTIALTPLQALFGGAVEVGVNGRRFRIALPPGVRTGDPVRLRDACPDGGDILLTALIRPSDGLSVLGDDLYMQAEVPPRLLDDGGRLEVATPLGPRSAWITPHHPTRRLCLRGLGLPARGRRPRGHLFVTLEPREETVTPAEDLLLRFSRVWTPDRLAA